MRVENFSIHLDAKGENLTAEEKSAIKDRFGCSSITNDYVVHVDYNLEIQYLGGVEKTLGLILSVLNKATNIKVDTKELNNSKSICQELLCKIEQIEQKYCKG